MRFGVRDERGDKGSLLFISEMIAVCNSVDAVLMLGRSKRDGSGANGTLASALLDWLFGGKCVDGQREEQAAAAARGQSGE